MATFALKIVAPDSIIFSGEVEHIKFTSATGEMMIYPGHEKYICTIAACKVEYKPASTAVANLDVKGGFCKFNTDGQNKGGVCEIAVIK